MGDAEVGFFNRIDRQATPGFKSCQLQTLVAARTLTQPVQSTLQPYASLPVVRKAVNGVYSETVKVPAGTTLSVVIQ
ncbi:hypothetical protein SB751_20075 [Cupriavidus sp. SIMBA_020]|uniref:M30 family zinc metallopeptidase n=1 Tax=Cupriavidus sp. SIMBA_020 TaxID=3085766 RepID=UPI00397A1D3C